MLFFSAFDFMAKPYDIVLLIRDWNFLILCKTIIALLATWFLVTTIYNIYFHPLAKYPGPKLAGATLLFYHLVSCNGNLTSWVRDMHEEYGEIVRVAPDRLSFTNPQAWKDIYGHRKPGQAAIIKDPNFYMPESNGEYSIVNTRDRDEHSYLRRIFSHAFSDKALKEQEFIIQRYVDKLIEVLRRHGTENPNEPVNLVKMYNCTTFDIMADLTFGEPLGLLENTEYTPWVTTMFKRFRITTFMMMSQDYPIIAAILGHFVPSDIKNARATHLQNSITRVDKRMERGNNESDIWNLVLKQEDGRISRQKMYANASLFMSAGTETTATQLSGLTYYLLTNPERLQRLTQEIRALPSEKALTLEALPRMPYMTACLQEGLRLYPPVAVGLHRLSPEGGMHVVGQWIPPKMRVAVPQLAINTSSTNFQNPRSYIPERWMPNGGYDDDRKDAAQAFSVGPANCLGKNLAWHELRLIVAKLLWHFDLELDSRSVNWLDHKVYTVWEKPPLLVKARVAC